jgi:N-acylneuraminate cytidylyltransferase
VPHHFWHFFIEGGKAEELNQNPNQSRWKTIAIIPARGGSKGVPRKNIRLLAGKPLIAHTIEQALSARTVGRTVVSTDDPEIAEVAENYGAETVRRPAELASDSASSESALMHCLESLHRQEGYEPDLVVFLQCTSPVRRPTDIDEAVQLLLEKKADSLLSVNLWHGFLWRQGEIGATAINFDFRERPRRQCMAEEFRENGSIYVFRPWVLWKENNRLGGKIIVYPMDFWSSFETDTLEDFSLCEWILTRSAASVSAQMTVSVNDPKRAHRPSRADFPAMKGARE